jgi:hypothetical protein
MRSVIEVSRVRTSLKSPPFENSQRVYLEITFDAMLKQAQAASTNLFVRAACSVAGRRMVDTVPVMDSLDDMTPGDTKESLATSTKSAVRP